MVVFWNCILAVEFTPIFTLMNVDADKKLLVGLRQLKDHLYGRVCELREELRAELRQSMTVSPKMKLFYGLIRRCKRVSAQVKRLAPKVRMAQLRFDMLSDPKWRKRVIDDLGGEKALQSWERRMAKRSALKGELWEEPKLYSAYVPGVGELMNNTSNPTPSASGSALSTSPAQAVEETLNYNSSTRLRGEVGARPSGVGSEGGSVRNMYHHRPNHKNFLHVERKSKPFDYSGITSNPLTVIDPCKLDREGYFRLAAIPRGEMEKNEERIAEPQPDWYKQKIIDLRKARAEQLKRFGREGLKPIPLTPTELREGIIIPFRQARLNRAAQPGAAVYKYDNDNWGDGPREAVAPKARSPN